MQVELLQLTPNAVEFIGKCAGICYDSKDEPEANRRRAAQCAQKGHLATLRFAHATFHVSGISRACSHQFVRSKHLDFLQRSQRYCKEDPTFVVLNRYEDYNIGLQMSNHYRFCYNFYNTLLERGVKKEDARFVLPEATTTELIVTGNLQAWQDFINLRSGKEAQWEIRQVACGISKHLSYHLPELFKEVYYA